MLNGRDTIHVGPSLEVAKRIQDTQVIYNMVVLVIKKIQAKYEVIVNIKNSHLCSILESITCNYKNILL